MKVEQIEQDARDAELTEESLDNIAGGGGPVVDLPEVLKTKINGSRSNIKTNLTDF